MNMFLWYKLLTLFSFFFISFPFLSALEVVVVSLHIHKVTQFSMERNMYKICVVLCEFRRAKSRALENIMDLPFFRVYSLCRV